MAKKVIHRFYFLLSLYFLLTFSEETFHLHIDEKNENSWLRVTLLHREVRNPGNEMIMETENRDESEENGIVVKNINDRAKKTRKKIVSERDDTKEVTVEKEEKIQTRTLIIIISVSSIFVLFAIAVVIVGVVQCHLNKSRAKTKRTISAAQLGKNSVSLLSFSLSSSSMNENQLNMKTSETHLIEPSMNESEGELIARTTSNSPFRADTISESGNSELIPLAKSVSAKSITHSRKKGVLSRRKSIGKEGKRNTPKTVTPMKTIPLHQKRERSSRRKEGSGRRNDGSSKRK
ncbi:hypothetical protein PRIPAC_92472 [Pristionchus pacificus]|nr:hypothetical protein PRIPAC_92472 [Pristionchus pacificus]